MPLLYFTLLHFLRELNWEWNGFVVLCISDILSLSSHYFTHSVVVVKINVSINVIPVAFSCPVVADTEEGKDDDDDDDDHNHDSVAEVSLAISALSPSSHPGLNEKEKEPIPSPILPLPTLHTNPLMNIMEGTERNEETRTKLKRGTTTKLIQ